MKRNRIIKICMTVAIVVIIIFFMIITVDFIEPNKISSIILKETPENIENEEKNKSKIRLPFTTAKTKEKARARAKAKEKEEIKKLSKNIVFSGTGTKAPYLTFNGKMGDGKIVITDGGRTINFKTPVFSKLGDKVVVYYWVTNNNTQDAKIGNLICSSPLSSSYKASDKSSKEEIETIDNTLVITSKNELKGTTVAGRTTSSYAGTIEIELINVPHSEQGEIINYEITCEMQAN